MPKLASVFRLALISAARDAKPGIPPDLREPRSVQLGPCAVVLLMDDLQQEDVKNAFHIRRGDQSMADNVVYPCSLFALRQKLFADLFVGISWPERWRIFCLPFQC